MTTGYQPLYIKGMESGLVQNRQNFILPDDAYPILQNAFIWREQIRRRQGLQLLSRLRRTFTTVSLGDSGASPWSFNIFTTVSPNIVEMNAEVQPGSVVIVMGGVTFTDQGNGTLTSPTMDNSGVINYITSEVTLTTTVSSGTAATITFAYYPGLPVMGIRTLELYTVNEEQTVFFDTVYAYKYTTSGFIELPSTAPTTWTGDDSEFFWSTNYWVNSSNVKLFWATNFSGPTGDPIRYYDGTTWTDFGPTASPTTGQIDNASPDPNFLVQCLCLLPFRGRLVAFNTYEGADLASSVNYYNRIRWSAIGNPLITYTDPPLAAGVVQGSWIDDLSLGGTGGYLDIPTSENITSVGFVRDNLVIYCERSTWQLRYTGRAISPFQIEKVNSELGARSTFSSVQFDTSLVGIGDKGIVECDSFQSKRIDIKIPDLVFNMSNQNQGPQRIQGIRDIQQRLAYWTYVSGPVSEDEISEGGTGIYPNRRLVYNYENDSWAIFTDSLTSFGVFQAEIGVTWNDATFPWATANFPWTNRNALFPSLVGGNQQGFIVYLGSNLTPQATNDVTLSITAITGNTTTPTVITSPNHNLVTSQVVTISEIPLETPFANTLNNPQQGDITAATQANPCQITSSNHGLISGTQVEINDVNGMTELNGNIYTVTIVDANNFTIGIDSSTYFAYTSGGTWTNEAVNAFGIVVLDTNTFQLWRYDPVSMGFNIPQLDSPATYVGGGKIAVRDGFIIQSKKFNFLDKGENIQMGYFDILMNATDSGAMTLNVFLNYNQNSPVNTTPQNVDLTAPSPGTTPNPAFNSIIPTTQPALGGISGTKYWQRVYCPVRGAFLTLQYGLSKAQLVGVEQESDIQIDAQILWLRNAGRLQTF